jgi:hypothetical protein
MLTNELAGNKQAESTHHLKSIFEQSLAVLREDNQNEDKKEDKNEHKNVVKKTSPNLRARRDFLPLHIDPANLQKRALDDAAKALAALWKISETGSRQTARPARRFS